ncbi:hypothetical protein C8F04DRAFT_1365050 [Mycena alexandri]|uniref:Uncharacterized protein n=1 Tax=Mycena alexandri TaxID=1745969 RepID=A0AAD6SN68_9AGAR|nr:hypothetical protein C8F04DRAFT_1365050 [Mycena alexandri]
MTGVATGCADDDDGADDAAGTCARTGAGEVLALRVYALYGCNKQVGAFLGVLIAGFLGVMIAVPILAFDFTGKPSIAGPKFIIAFYASPMTFDIIMTAMTVYKVLDHTRHGWSSSLMKRMLRDGLFLLFCHHFLEPVERDFFHVRSPLENGLVFPLTIIPLSSQPNELIQAINAPMSIQISSVLCCRLILDLRSENEGKPAVRKYSNTRGRWVTEIIHEDFGPQDTIQFSARSPGAEEPESELSTQDGITKFSDVAFIYLNPGVVLHFEQEVHTDRKSEVASPATDLLPV